MKIVQKILVWLILSFINVNSVYSQNEIANIFSNTVNRYTSYVNDTAYINYLIREGGKCNSKDSAATIYLKSLRLSKEINYYRGIVYSLIDLSSSAQNTDVGLSYGFLALEYSNKWLANDSNATDLRDLIYYNIGNKYFDQGAYGNCVYYLYKVLENVRQNGAYKTSIRMFDSHSKKIISTNTRIVFGTYYLLGQIWSKVGNIPRALESYNMAEHIARANKDTILLAHAWNGLAALYHDEGRDIQKSDYYCYKVLALQGISLRVADDAKSILAGNMLSKDPNKTITLAQSILEKGQSASDASSIANTYLLLGFAYVKLKDYSLAEAYTLRALEMAEDIGWMNNTPHIHSLLAEIYEATRQYKKALEHEKQFVLYKDSLIIKNQKKIEGLESANQISIKNKALMQKQLLIWEQEHRLNIKNLWLGGTFVAALLLAIIGFYKYRNSKQKQKVLQHEQEIAKLNALIRGEETERTRIARELHDGIISQLSAVKMNFNAIPIQGLNENVSHDYHDSVQQLEDSIKELRTTAHNLMPEILLNAGLLEALHVFCEKAGKSSGIYIDYQTYGIMPDLEESFELSVYRIVQELTHNIIKHAQASSALVQLSFQNNLLSIIVEDDGIGMDQNNIATAGGGRGLAILKERIKLLHGALDIKSSSGSGTAIYIEFEIKK